MHRGEKGLLRILQQGEGRGRNQRWLSNLSLKRGGRKRSSGDDWHWIEEPSFPPLSNTIHWSFGREEREEEDPSVAAEGEERKGRGRLRRAQLGVIAKN